MKNIINQIKKLSFQIIFCVADTGKPIDSESDEENKKLYGIVGYALGDQVYSADIKLFNKIKNLIEKNNLEVQEVFKEAYKKISKSVYFHNNRLYLSRNRS